MIQINFTKVSSETNYKIDQLFHDEQKIIVRLKIPSINIM